MFFFHFLIFLSKVEQWREILVYANVIMFRRYDSENINGLPISDRSQLGMRDSNTRRRILTGNYMWGAF